MAWVFPKTHVLIRGGGDLASGVACRLHRSGFPVVILERPRPLFVRRMVCFGNVVFDDNTTFTVEGITSQLVTDADEIDAILARGHIPVLVDPDGETMPDLRANVVIDARMQKNPLDTTIDDAPLVVGMGPGYVAGENCHAVIETNRGHRLGRVMWHGSAQADTGTPGKVSGYDRERVLRANETGFVIAAEGVEIGALLQQGDLIATLNGTPISAPFPGALRGIIHPSVEVWAGLKIGDIDPRNSVENCFTISDKALSMGGAALEAILQSEVFRTTLKDEVSADAAP